MAVFWQSPNTQSRGWRAPTRLVGWLVLVLLGMQPLPLTSGASVFRTGVARAQAVAATPTPPSGYAVDKIGAIRWTYPRSAADAVKALQAYQGYAWRRVVGELGVSVSPNLDIRVALNPEQMQALAPQGLPLPGYADGIALPEQGLILLTLTEPETWFRPDMKTVLTHELSHVALHRAVGGAAVPRWFTEGVAVHQAAGSSINRMRTLWDGTLRGQLIPLDQLESAFPASHSDVDLAYAQSADFVGFMLSGHDERVRFHKLLGKLATHKSFGDAVKNAYQVPLGYMEREWRSTLSQRFGRWPVLLMGLTFIWVLGAMLLVFGYLRTRRKNRATLRRWAIEEAPLAEVPAVPPPVPAAAVHSNVDEFFDKRGSTRTDSGVPTVVHDGQSHTLH